MSREIPRNAPHLFIVAESFRFPAAAILLDPQAFRGSEASLRAPGLPREAARLDRSPPTIGSPLTAPPSPGSPSGHGAISSPRPSASSPVGRIRISTASYGACPWGYVDEQPGGPGVGSMPFSGKGGGIGAPPTKR